MEVVLPKPGSYVVAVSGGVDSMALLHLLQKQPKLSLTVAHFDHGIRSDSSEDRKLVQKITKEYGLPFVFHEGRLGIGASEAKARKARYDFLRGAQKASQAKAIITAHHQDDVLETIILNMLRGTGRKGATSLKNQKDILRPLLNVSKSELIDYAQAHNLKWREDPSNQNLTYLRNYIRHKIMSRFTTEDRVKLVRAHTNLTATNQELDILLAVTLKAQSSPNQLDRQWFNLLPHAVAKETLAAWLRANDLGGFDRNTLERLVVAAKVAAAGKSFPVLAGSIMSVDKDSLALTGLER